MRLTWVWRIEDCCIFRNCCSDCLLVLIIIINPMGKWLKRRVGMGELSVCFFLTENEAELYFWIEIYSVCNWLKIIIEWFKKNEYLKRFRQLIYILSIYFLMMFCIILYLLQSDAKIFIQRLAHPSPRPHRHSLYSLLAHPRLLSHLQNPKHLNNPR